MQKCNRLSTLLCKHNLRQICSPNLFPKRHILTVFSNVPFTQKKIQTVGDICSVQVCDISTSSLSGKSQWFLTTIPKMVKILHITHIHGRVYMECIITCSRPFHLCTWIPVVTRLRNWHRYSQDRASAYRSKRARNRGGCYLKLVTAFSWPQVQGLCAQRLAYNGVNKQTYAINLNRFHPTWHKELWVKPPAWPHLNGSLC